MNITRGRSLICLLIGCTGVCSTMVLWEGAFFVLTHFSYLVLWCSDGSL